LRQVRGVRSFFLLLGLTVCLVSARAQEQEHKLVDRLLRPDMSLASTAQDKKFTAVGGTSVDQKFVAKSFYSGDEKPTKSFWGVKIFSSKEFETRGFSRADAAANAKTNAEIAYANTEFPTKKSSLIRTSSNEGKLATVRDYADNRPFLAKGTRQNMLNQKNKPLTIDEVRELLNKNK
jgi:hypothetical protein